MTVVDPYQPFAKLLFASTFWQSDRLNTFKVNRLTSRLLPIVALATITIGCGDSHKEEEMTNLSDPFGKSQLSDTLRELPVSFGDNVRIVESPLTKELGISGLTGQVYGETTPSVSGVEVIGELQSDAAVNVYIEELEKDYWLTPSLVELIDHAPGTTISIGDRELIRTEDGEWKEIE